MQLRNFMEQSPILFQNNLLIKKNSYIQPALSYSDRETRFWLVGFIIQKIKLW
jgi:hypothetical protein